MTNLEGWVHSIRIRDSECPEKERSADLQRHSKFLQHFWGYFGRNTTVRSQVSCPLPLGELSPRGTSTRPITQ